MSPRSVHALHSASAQVTVVGMAEVGLQHCSWQLLAGPLQNLLLTEALKNHMHVIGLSLLHQLLLAYPGSPL